MRHKSQLDMRRVATAPAEKFLCERRNDNLLTTTCVLIEYVALVVAQY